MGKKQEDDSKGRGAQETHAVVILGSGPAGLTAGIYAARSALAPLLLSGRAPGGQLMITTDVENYPGFAALIQGPWLMEQMRAQALACGCRIEDSEVTTVDLRRRPFLITSATGLVVAAQSLIIATGAESRWLGLESEAAYRGFGVSACATCDGFFFRDKEVAVVGGGNTAVEEALFLTRFARKVFLLHRGDRLRATAVLQERLRAHPKIEIMWNTRVTEVLGVTEPRGVTGLRLSTKAGAEHLAIGGLFVAIGHDPATSVFRGQLELDAQGYILPQAVTAAITTAGSTTATSCPGVFAAGDVSDKVYRQAVTAAGMGCMAALDCERFLAENEAEPAAVPGGAASP